MAIRVGANEPRPTHDIKLTDGSSSVGLILCDGTGKHRPRIGRNPLLRTTIKTYQGNMGPSDMELPWSPIVQQDWSGGMLNEYLNEASNRFYYGSGVDTTRDGRVIMGGLPTPNMMVDNNNSNWPSPTSAGGTFAWRRINTGTTLWYAVSFVPSGNYTATKLMIPMMRKGSPVFKVLVYTDVAGSPGALHGTIFNKALAFPDENMTDMAMIDFSGIALTGGVTYWLVWTATSVSATAYVDLVGTTSSATCKTSANGTTWAADSGGVPIYFLTAGSLNHNDTILFQYKHAVYAVTKGGVVWMNGYRGVATTGSNTTTIELATSPFSAAGQEYAGAICILYNGTGSQEKRYWRVITSHDANTLTFSEPWDVAPSTDTEFVIVGRGRWQVVTPTSGSLPTNVTDVKVWSGNVYFCQGDSTDVVRMRIYNNAGTITNTFAAQSGHQGTFMTFQPDSDTTRLLYMKLNGLLHWETAPAEGSDLPTYATTNEKQVGDPYERVNGMILYDEDNALWVFMTTAAYIVKASGNDADGTFNYTPLKFKLSEIGTAGDYRLGRASVTHNVYLYFSLQNTLQRYYSGVLDSVGLDQGTSLPDEFGGNIIFMYAYPGRLMASIESKPTLINSYAIGDGPDYITEVSRASIVTYYNGGWHPVWTAGYAVNAGYDTRLTYRVGSMLVQSTPGDYADRLWFTWGPFLMWIPIAINPLSITSLEFQPYHYTFEGHFITSWLQLGLTDISKFWHSLKLIHQDWGSTSTIVDYQTDTDNDWVLIDEWDTALSQILYSEEKNLSSTHVVNGKQIRFRVRIRNYNTNTTPKLKTMVTEALVRVPVKRSIPITFRVADYDHDINGDPDDEISAEAKLTLLEGWEDDTTPLTISSKSSRVDGKRVFFDPYSSIEELTTYKDGTTGREYHICRATLIEV